MKLQQQTLKTTQITQKMSVNFRFAKQVHYVTKMTGMPGRQHHLYTLCVMFEICLLSYQFELATVGDKMSGSPRVRRNATHSYVIPSTLTLINAYEPIQRHVLYAVAL